MLTLTRREWTARRAVHERRVDAWIHPHLERSSRHETHPVHDFLFEYYHHRPSQLRRWHPGIGVALEDAGDFAGGPIYREEGGRTWIDPDLAKSGRRKSAAWITGLLRATAERPPFFGCAGLHEWAMVHRAEPEGIRHAGQRLRLPPEGIAGVVESQPIRCTHFDAFRFFTPEARPLNRLQPTRESMTDLEQSGCLHANMDLYKWAFKLSPFTPGELVADTFELARAIREVDMRASPYDLRDLGFDPIEIETAGGRAEYERHQRNFQERAIPLRDELIRVGNAVEQKGTKITKNSNAFEQKAAKFAKG